MDRKKDDPKLVELKTMDEIQKNEFLDSFDFIVSDTEGIIWKNGKAKKVTKGILRGLKRIRKMYRFIIDDSYTTDEAVVKGLNKLGVDFFNKRNVLTPAKIMLHYLREFKKDQAVYSLCNDITNDYLENHCIEVISNTTPGQDLNVFHMEYALEPIKEVGAVLIDVNLNTSFYALSLAQEYLRASPDADVLCSSAELMYKIKRDLSTIGAATRITTLRESIKRKPIVLNRPHSYVGTDILRYFVINDPERVLFIGNSLEKDIKFAKRCGFQTLFLKNNECQHLDLRAMPEVNKPNYIADFFTDLAKFVDLSPDPPRPVPRGVPAPVKRLPTLVIPPCARRKGF